MNAAHRDRERTYRAVFVQYGTEKKNKVRATQILERAQPSLKIKGGMTFNAKEHRGSEAETQRASSFIAHSQNKLYMHNYRIKAMLHI